MISVTAFFLILIGITIIIGLSFISGMFSNTNAEGDAGLVISFMIGIAIMVGLATITFNADDNDECVLICNQIELQAHKYADSKQCLCIVPRK